MGVIFDWYLEFLSDHFYRERFHLRRRVLTFASLF